MNLVSEIIRGVFFMPPDIARQYFPVVHNILTGNINPIRENKNNLDTTAKFVNTCNNNIQYRDVNLITDFQQDRVQPNSLFCVNLIGAITKYDQFCGPQGTRSLADSLKLADQNPNIIGHILCLDSGGGEGYAAHEFAASLKSLSKPVFAFIEGMAASAAYLIASACSLVCASSNLDRVGSIGTYITLADYSKWYQMQGIKLTEVYAEKSKDKNRDYLDAIAGDTTKVQKLVDEFNEFFIQSVISYRHESFPDDQHPWATGKMFFAQDAKQIGLIDIIAPFDDFVNSIIDNISTKP